MKKLLYITAFPPCQKTGGQSFSLNAINELSQQFQIDVIYFEYGEHQCEIESIRNIKRVEKIKIKPFDFIHKFWIHPTFTRRFNKQILKYIKNISSGYDVLYFDYSQVSFYSLYIKHPCKILRMHDVLFQKYNRKNYILEKWITSTERKVLNSFDKIFVPSIKDVELIKTVYDINVLYTNEYLKNIIMPDAVEQKKQFIFYGYWKRTENTEGLIWFINKVLPLIKTDLKIIVIGGGLPFEVQEKFIKPNKIEYLGFVDNPLDIIMQSSAVLVPLFQGAGIKVKVIDSFTVGTPVIGTDLAFEGLPNMQNLSYLIKDEIEYAETINNFIPMSYEMKINKAREFNNLYNNHHLLEQI